MYKIIDSSDFKGIYTFQKGRGGDSFLNEFIETYQTEFLSKLLGAKLSKTLVAELESGDPLTERIQTIYDPINIDESCFTITTEGIKKYLVGIVWFYYARENASTISASGNNSPQSQNSINSVSSDFLTKSYNRSIRNGKKIQKYICLNSDVYEEYNGQELKFCVGL